MKKITLCSFQPRSVYEEILKCGTYQLSIKDFLLYSGIEKSYIHYHKGEKYERLMKKSGLSFYPNTMPIWAWHKDEFSRGICEVTPLLYKGVLERIRKNTPDNYEERVGIFLEVQESEEYYFSKIDDIHGNVKVQEILPQLKKEWIVEVLEEKKVML